jgi:hypothetical protein
MWTPKGYGSAQGWYKPAGSTFTSPLDLANLYAWYKSDAGVTFTGTIGTDAAATAWADQSGVSGVTLTKTGSSAINYGVTADNLNGKPTIGFIGGGYLTATMALGNTTGPAGKSQLSVWCVFKEDASVSGRIMAYSSSGTDTSADGVIPIFYASDTSVSAFSSGVKSTGTVVLHSWNRLASVFDGTNSTVYVNDTANTAVASANVFGTSGTVILSTSAPGTGNDLTGNLAELIIVKGVLSAQNISDLKAYCLTRWGI